MNKFKYIFSLLVILLSTVVTLLNPFVVNGATQYDDTIQLTDSLYFHSTGDGYTLPTECSSMPTVDLSSRWSEFVTELASDGEIDFGDNALIQMNYSFTSTTDASAYSAWQNKTKWAVSQYTRENPYGYSNQISITWTDTEPENASFAYVGGDNRLVVTNSTNVYQMNITFDGSTDCTIEANTSYNSTVGNSPNINYPVIAWQGSTDPWKIFFANWNITYPSGYEGVIAPDSEPKAKIYPGMSVIVQDNSADTDTAKVSLTFADSWLDWLSANNLSKENYYSIFTVTDMEDNIIEFDGLCGRAACTWNALPLGDYKARLNVLFQSTEVNENYEFGTTEVWFRVNNTSYTMLYNPNEGKYCTVRAGYEWNCSIPQPGETPSIIDGTPEEWLPEQCTIDGFPWIDLGACIRNAMHYLAEYLGINGPSVGSASSPFFQFDSNTFGLTAILTSPITILNSLAGAQYTCTTVNLPMPFINTNLPLPCMQSYYTTYLGQLYTLWQTVINGIVAYYVIVGILKMVKDAKDPQKDQIEVLKL